MTEDAQVRSTHVRLPEDVHRALQAEAARQGVSMGEAIRQAVSLWLDHVRWLEQRGEQDAR